MQYFVGVDIGTTTIKCVAFSPAGDVLRSVAVEYSMHHPKQGRSEQDASLIFEETVVLLEDVLKHFSTKPQFISFSSAMHSIMAVNNVGDALTQLIIWADNRAKDISEDLHAKGNAGFFYERTGVPVHPMSPLCKLLWIKENEPDIFNTAHKFIGIKEYIFYKLFDRFVVDASVASATGIFNIQTLQWDADILSFIGLDETRLSEVVSTKSVYYCNGYETGHDFLNGIPIVIGASDGALANIGTYAKDDIMAVTIGTSGAARMVIDTCVLDNAMRTFCYYISDGCYIMGGANNNGAVVLQWLKEQVLQKDGSYDMLFKSAEDVEPGCNGLIMLPYLLGERAPLWNADAKAVFFGLTKRHGQSHFIRAAMEGVIFSMFSIAKILVENKEVTAVHASGGFAKSPLWLQILADVFNIPVHLSGAQEAAAYGAVILGAGALGIEATFGHSIIGSFYPSGERTKLYRKSFQKFERLNALLADEMSEK